MLSFLFILPSVANALTVLYARGTGEVQNASVLAPIANSIAAAIPGTTTQDVIYPASLNLVSSVYAGINYTRAQLYTLDAPVVLIGYSQGAVVTEAALVGTNLSNQNLQPLPMDVRSKVVAVIQFGDPTRVDGQGIDEGDCSTPAPLARTGQAKDLMDQFKLQDWCSAQDPVCCGGGNDTTAHTSYFGDTTTMSVVAFVKDALSNSSITSSSTVLPTSTVIRPTAPASASISASPTPSQPATYTGLAARTHLQWLAAAVSLFLVVLM